MMAVDSKQGDSTNPVQGALTGTPSLPAASTNGSTNGQKRTRKRPSSLLAQGTSLPSVESSLDEFIARANETAVDPNELNAVALDLQKQSGVRHATWEVSTTD